MTPSTSRIRPTSVPVASFAAFAAIAVVLVVGAGCNGIVRGLPVVVSNGVLTESADGPSVIRLSESGVSKCGTEEPNDVELVLRLASIGKQSFAIGKSASASVDETDPVCGLRRSDDATSGTVRIDDVTSTSVHGSYALEFGGHGSLNGTFNATTCKAPAGDDIDEPDCDDVDHNGEPGEQHSTGGGGGDGD